MEAHCGCYHVAHLYVTHLPFEAVAAHFAHRVQHDIHQQQAVDLAVLRETGRAGVDLHCFGTDDCLRQQAACRVIAPLRRHCCWPDGIRLSEVAQGAWPPSADRAMPCPAPQARSGSILAETSRAETRRGLVHRTG